MKHFLGGCDVDDTRGELYSLFSLSLSSSFKRSFVACFDVFLPSDVERFVAICGRREIHAVTVGDQHRTP